MTNFIFNKIKNFIDSTAFEYYATSKKIKCIVFDSQEINHTGLQHLSKNEDFEKNLNLVFESIIVNVDHFYDVKINILFSICDFFDKKIYADLIIKFIQKIFKIEKYGLPSKSFVTCLELLLEEKFLKKEFWINLWENSNPQCKYIYYCALKNEELFEEVLRENNSVIFIDRILKEKIHDNDYVNTKIQNLLSFNDKLSEKLRTEYMDYKNNSTITSFSTRASEIV